jgi:prevent-host-death family protein
MSKKPDADPPATPTTYTVKASEFKAKCLELMNVVRESQVAYVVTKRGEPVAMLGPVGNVVPNPFGFMRGTVLEARDIVAPDHKAWAESGSDPLLHD